MNTRIIAVIALVVVVIGVVAFLTIDRGDKRPVYTETQVFEVATTIEGDYTVLPKEQTTLENDAVLTVTGNVIVDGAIGCRDGKLTVIAEGNLVVNGALLCEEENSEGIVIVLGGTATFDEDSEVSTTGHVQVVDSLDSVMSEGELNQLYDDVATVPAEGQSVGPFVSEDDPSVPDTVALTEADEENGAGFLSQVATVAHAQDPLSPVITGNMRVNTPPPGIKRLVIFNFPRAEELTVQDFELAGPDGRKGTDDNGGSCNATGGDGEDAFRFTAVAPNLKVNNFTLNLGNGGEGGEAETSKDCDPGIAKGGKGGESGNFRMIGQRNFEITGAFLIHPGNGGAGGGATAHGKDGGPSEDGGDANATGGDGADNKKKLSVQGTVSGTSNVKVGDIVGGVGGAVSAEPGNGGAGEGCGQDGGNGGAGTAKSGDGGDASLSGAPRMEFASDIGGQGGIVESFGGKGGAGGSCDATGPGGTGGDGGDASSKEGKGGQGDSGRAADGVVLDETGGDGGDGGDGCLPGAGGSGGNGDPEGEDGEEGDNLCITITKEENFISLRPGEIEVIKYMDYYIPIANGNVERFTDPRGEECEGEEHWHPGPGGAVNTMGYPTPDPDPNNCGFGKTSEVPVQVIDDPNYVEGGAGAEGNLRGGQMIEIDPPVLIIPAG